MSQHNGEEYNADLTLDIALSLSSGLCLMHKPVCVSVSGFFVLRLKSSISVAHILLAAP